MKTKTAKSHVTLVAALHIGFGALHILLAFILFFILNFASDFIPDLDEIGRSVLSLSGTIIPGIIIFFGGIDLFAGLVLLGHKPWSRVFVIVISAINCLNVPLGTAKGVYSIWALMQPEVQELFESKQ